MANLRRIALALLVFVAARSPCQESTAAGAGKRVDVSFDMAGLRASALNVGVGIDIARFLGLGVLWGLGFAVDGTTDLEAGLWCTAYNGTFLERIEYDDSDSANMEIVDERVDEIAFGCDECGVSDGGHRSDCEARMLEEPNEA